MADDIIPVEPTAEGEPAAPDAGAKLALQEFEPAAPLATDAASDAEDKSAADLAHRCSTCRCTSRPFSAAPTCR